MKNIFLSKFRRLCLSKVTWSFLNPQSQDLCCVPAGKTIDGQRECTLKRGKNCSPSQGPCCNRDTCDFKSSAFQCARETDCRNAVQCSGSSHACSLGTPKPDKTICAFKTQVCLAPKNQFFDVLVCFCLNGKCGKLFVQIWCKKRPYKGVFKGLFLTSDFTRFEIFDFSKYGFWGVRRGQKLVQTTPRHPGTIPHTSSCHLDLKNVKL